MQKSGTFLYPVKSKSLSSDGSGFQAGTFLYPTSVLPNDPTAQRLNAPPTQNIGYHIG